MNKRSMSQRLPATHVTVPGKISVIVLAAALAACVGGGSDGSSATMPLVPTPSAADPDAVVTTPTRTLDLRWGARASRYVLPTTDNVTARIVAQTGRYTFTGLYGQQTFAAPVGLDASTPLDKSTSLMQEVWVTSDVKRAWSEGWTGAGVRIAVIDDFTPDQVSEFLTVPIPSGCNTVQGVTVCPSATTAAFRMTHGDQVSAIAGGSLTGLPGLWVESGTYSAPLDLGFYSGGGPAQLCRPAAGTRRPERVHRLTACDRPPAIDETWPQAGVQAAAGP